MRIDNNKIYANINKIETPSMYDLFSKIEIIPLETTKESLIKEISKLVFYDNKYYILDYPLSKIFVFDEMGKFLFNIDNRGNGPNEYVHIGSFNIDPYNHQLIILSAVDRSLHFYDLDGHFKNKIKLPEIERAYKTIQSLNKDTIVFWTFDLSNRMKYYSLSENKIIHEDFPEEKKDIFCTDEFPINGYLCRALTDKVYTLKKGKTQIAYTWDFGEENNLSKVIYPQTQERESFLKYGDDVYSSRIVNHLIGRHGQNNRYLYAQVIIKRRYINVFYNKLDKTTLLFEKTKENATINPVEWTDEYIISITGDIKKEEILPSNLLNKELSDKLKQLQEDDNPILIKHTFL